jgi:hypothetical protein
MQQQQQQGETPLRGRVVIVYYNYVQYSTVHTSRERVITQQEKDVKRV